MKMYSVSEKSWTTNYRVQPVGSEHFMDIQLMGVFPSREQAIRFIADDISATYKSVVDQFLNEDFPCNESFGNIKTLENGDIELKFSDDLGDTYVYEIEEIEIPMEILNG